MSGVWVPRPMPPALGLPSAPLGAHHLSALPTANTNVSLVEDFSPGPQTHTGGQEPPGAPQPPCPWMEPLEASLTLAASSPDGAELRCPQASLLAHSSWAALPLLSSPRSTLCFLCCLRKILALALLLRESRLWQNEFMN